jgi:hypothetical protein
MDAPQTGIPLSESWLDTHPVASVWCVVLAFSGGAMLFAFFVAFSQLNILARSVTTTRKRQKGLLWWYLLSDWYALWEIWQETKGMRWLLPLGLMLSGTAYVIYRVYLPSAD